jgi:hypothetical protein
MGHTKEAGFVKLPDAQQNFEWEDGAPLLSPSGPRRPTQQQQQRLPRITPVAEPPLRVFPISFNGYYQKRITTVFHLGEHAHQPIFAVKTHTGWSGAPGVVLHSGPSDKDPPLAAAGNETGLETERHKDTLVILPPLPGSGTDSSHEYLRHDPTYRTESYRFNIDVGLGGDKGMYPEEFEWRRSLGDEVKELNNKKNILGWELVRLSSDMAIRPNETGEGSARVTADGKEMVAVWAPYAGWSLTKAFRFQFMGSGASGELGERWATMAVITALRLWCLEGMGQTDEGLVTSSASM